MCSKTRVSRMKWWLATVWETNPSILSTVMISNLPDVLVNLLGLAMINAENLLQARKPYVTHSIEAKGEFSSIHSSRKAVVWHVWLRMMQICNIKNKSLQIKRYFHVETLLAHWWNVTDLSLHFFQIIESQPGKFHRAARQPRKGKLRVLIYIKSQGIL